MLTARRLLTAADNGCVDRSRANPPSDKAKEAVIFNAVDFSADRYKRVALSSSNHRNNSRHYFARAHCPRGKQFMTGDPNAVNGNAVLLVIHIMR